MRTIQQILSYAHRLSAVDPGVTETIPVSAAEFEMMVAWVVAAQPPPGRHPLAIDFICISGRNLEVLI